MHGLGLNDCKLQQLILQSKLSQEICKGNTNVEPTEKWILI